MVVLCRTLQVSTSGFYDWRARLEHPSHRRSTDEFLTELINEIHDASRGTYGSPRVHAELRLGEGIHVGEKRVARLMRTAGIEGIYRRRHRKGTTRRDPRHQSQDDLVCRQFTVERPDALWVGDVTEHPTAEGKVYLATVLDALLATGDRLVDRRSSAHRARRRRIADGDLATERPVGSDGDAHRPRIPIHVLGLRTKTAGGRASRARWVRSATPSTRRWRRASWHTPARAARPQHAGRRGVSSRLGDLRVHRGLLQPARRHSSIDYLSPVEFESRYTDAGIPARSPQPTCPEKRGSLISMRWG